MSSPGTARASTLCGQFRSTVEAHPHNIAVHHRGQNTSYAELGRRARLVAARLSEAGIGHGDRVAIILPNSIDYIVSFYGILLGGGCAVALNPEAPCEELGRVLVHCQAKGAIVSARAYARLQAASVSLDTLAVILVADNPNAQADAATVLALRHVFERGDAPWPPPVSPSDLAQIIYTSGTTGRSKGVMLQHRALVANCRSIVSYLALRESDGVFVTLPFFYSYGTSLLLTHVAVGGRLVLASDFVFLKNGLDLMREQGATGFAGVPSSYTMLLQHTDLLQRRFPALRYLTCAGGALSPDVILTLRKAFPGVAYYAMYGQTEAAARLSTLLPDELDAHLGSIGRGIPGVELRVVDDAGCPVAPGIVGEIVARGDNLMLGYWNDPAATALALRPEGLRTGDLARVDEEGYIYIVGRKSDIIKCGAHRVGPQDIEDVLLQSSAIGEAAVVGKPDPLLGEVPVAFVVAAPGQAGLSTRELITFANERLPRYMWLREVRPVDTLPKTASGKVLRRVLREMLAAEELLHLKE